MNNFITPANLSLWKPTWLTSYAINPTYSSKYNEVLINILNSMLIFFNYENKNRIYIYFNEDLSSFRICFNMLII
jgi:hypothetical protein